MTQQNHGADNYAATLGAKIGSAMAPSIVSGATSAIKQQAMDSLKPSQNLDSTHLFNCIPLMPGQPSEHRMGLKAWMIALLVAQLAVAVLRIVMLHDFAGGLWMLLTAAIGFYGYWNYMNITYLSCWGVICVVNGFLDLLQTILPLIFGILKFDFLLSFIRFSCPFTYWFSASFAYHLYLDYAEENLIPTGWMTKVMPDMFWLLRTKLSRRRQQLPLVDQQVLSDQQNNYGGQKYAHSPPQQYAAQQPLYKQFQQSKANAAHVQQYAQPPQQYAGQQSSQSLPQQHAPQYSHQQVSPPGSSQSLWDSLWGASTVPKQFAEDPQYSQQGQQYRQQGSAGAQHYSQQGQQGVQQGGSQPQQHSLHSSGAWFGFG